MKIQLCAFADEADNSLNGQIEALKANGIRLLEIRNADGQNVADFSEDKAREIKAALDKAGIKVFSVGSPIGKIKVADDFDSHILKLKHVLKLCKIFECNKIRMFSFFTEEPEKHRGLVIERLNKMVALAKAEKISLYHENEKDIYGDTVKRVSDLLENVPGLKSVYDPANFLQAGEDINNALDAVFPKADYFHIKDVIVKTGELVPAGEGGGQIEKMISLIDRDAVLTIEPHLAVFDGYKNIDATEMKNKYVFSSNREAFDCAVNAVKNIIKRQGRELI